MPPGNGTARPCLAEAAADRTAAGAASSGRWANSVRTVTMDAKRSRQVSHDAACSATAGPAPRNVAHVGDGASSGPVARPTGVEHVGHCEAPARPESGEHHGVEELMPPFGDVVDRGSGVGHRAPEDPREPLAVEAVTGVEVDERPFVGWAGVGQNAGQRRQILGRGP